VFALVLAGLDLVGLRSAPEQGVALAIISTVGVLVIALLGRRLGGSSVGLVAATIAAIHPLWIQPAGIGMSESIFLVVLPAVLLSAVLFLDDPTALRALILGVAVGIATLTRSESIALVVVLGVPAVLLAVKAWRTRVTFAAALFAGCFVLVAPWIGRNFVQFGGFALSTQQGAAFGATNCPETYDGPGIGGFAPECFKRGVIAAYLGPLRAEAERRNPLHLSHELQRMGFAYMASHRERLPSVVLARILRGWGLFATADQLHYDVAFEGRQRELQRAGEYLNWLLLPISVVGTVLVPRRCWRRWSVVLAGPVVFTVTSAAIYGSVRLRTMAEPSIALLAAAALVAATKRTRSGWQTHPGRDDAAGTSPWGRP
jgi:4-amino-4-deoxy-L-arabinose transferase-like glycosyltransferase